VSSDAKISELELLQLVLSFGPRAEAKLSFLFGLNLALVGFAMANLTLFQLPNVFVMVPLVIFLVAVSISVVNLYKAYSPQLEGGRNSLVYFSRIAKREQKDFSEAFCGASKEDIRDDLLEQVWRNSVIISSKFKRIQDAFVQTIVSIPFLVIYLIADMFSTGELFRVV